MSVAGIPSQSECNPEEPTEHVLWALRALPMFAGSGMVTHSGFLRGWSKHLVDAGFRHVDWIRRLADENGNIHVDKLPKQRIKFQAPFRGPGHQYNNAARWVGADEREPETFELPNIDEMTTQEKYALAYMLDQQGIKLPEHLKRKGAEVERKAG